MTGLITAPDISGSLGAKNIVMGVLEKGIELSNLVSVVTQCQVPELTGTIPISSAGAITEDLDELEYSDIETGGFTNVDFSLKKDRVKLAVSDEAGYKSKVGDPLTIQKTSAGSALGAILDKKIIAALQTTPQTSATAGAWSTITNNPLADLGLAASKILPYKADFVVMTPAVYAKYLANNFVKDAGQGNPAAMRGAVSKVPALDLDIFVNSQITAKSCIVGASTGVCAALGNGPVKVRNWDDGGLGAKVYQMDVFRQVKAPIFLTSASKNMSVYQVTAVIA